MAWQEFVPCWQPTCKVDKLPKYHQQQGINVTSHCILLCCTNNPSPPPTHNMIGPLITLPVVKELVIQEIWSNKNICHKFVCLHCHGKFTHYGEVILFIHLLMLKSTQEQATSYDRVPGNRMEDWPLKTSHTLHTPITPFISTQFSLFGLLSKHTTIKIFMRWDQQLLPQKSLCQQVEKKEGYKTIHRK